MVTKTVFNLLILEIMIIPFFIPHSGCPHQCVFCNQRKITGKIRPPDPSTVPASIETCLAARGDQSTADVAFYGGSFTALPHAMQEAYLNAVQPHIAAGRIGSIRISTRPDGISGAILDLLDRYHVGTIELGVQSLDDHVLEQSGRGHTSEDTIKAVRMLRENGFTVGIQLMPGLPGDSRDSFRRSVEHVISLRPDFVRIYPTLVIAGTELELLYGADRYLPLSLDEALSWCKEALLVFEQAGIEVLRVGLQSTEELERPGTVLAGPYHPAFKQLVLSSIFLDRMRKALDNKKEAGPEVTFLVNPKDQAAAVGQKRSNLISIRSEFNLQSIRMMADRNIPRGTVQLV